MHHDIIGCSFQECNHSEWLEWALPYYIVTPHHSQIPTYVAAYLKYYGRYTELPKSQVKC
jgi:hypothetical protein